MDKREGEFALREVFAVAFCFGILFHVNTLFNQNPFLGTYLI